MKRVRLMVGAAGLAPIVGVMMPNAPAIAGHTPAPAPKTGSKTVSLSHTGVAPAITPCDGVEGYTVTKFFGDLKFWSGYNGSSACIGTVEGSWTSWPDSPDWKFRVRIYSGPGDTHRAYSNKVGCTKHNVHTIYCADGVHKYYNYPIQVCVAWSKNFDPLGGPATHSVTSPICKTIDRR